MQLSNITEIFGKFFQVKEESPQEVNIQVQHLGSAQNDGIGGTQTSYANALNALGNNLASFDITSSDSIANFIAHSSDPKSNIAEVVKQFAAQNVEIDATQLEQYIEDGSVGKLEHYFTSIINKDSLFDPKNPSAIATYITQAHDSEVPSRINNVVDVLEKEGIKVDSSAIYNYVNELSLGKIENYFADLLKPQTSGESTTPVPVDNTEALSQLSSQGLAIDSNQLSHFASESNMNGILNYVTSVLTQGNQAGNVSVSQANGQMTVDISTDQGNTTLVYNAPELIYTSAPEIINDGGMYPGTQVTEEQINSTVSQESVTNGQIEAVYSNPNTYPMEAVMNPDGSVTVGHNVINQQQPEIINDSGMYPGSSPVISQQPIYFNAPEEMADFLVNGYKSPEDITTRVNQAIPQLEYSGAQFDISELQELINGDSIGKIIEYISQIATNGLSTPEQHEGISYAQYQQQQNNIPAGYQTAQNANNIQQQPVNNTTVASGSTLPYPVQPIVGSPTQNPLSGTQMTNSNYGVPSAGQTQYVNNVNAQQQYTSPPIQPAVMPQGYSQPQNFFMTFITSFISTLMNMFNVGNNQPYQSPVAYTQDNNQQNINPNNGVYRS